MSKRYTIEVIHPERADFTPKLQVVAGYLEVADTFLLMKRASHKSAGDLWGMPAGKVEAGESFMDALIREMWEETGVTLSKEEVAPLGTLFFRNQEINFSYHMYRIVYLQTPTVRLNDEHTEYDWVTHHEAESRDLVPGALEALSFIKNSLFHRG